jgi:hypothetical protein
MYEQNERLIIEAVDVAGIDVLEEDLAPASCCGCGCCIGKVAAE